MAGLAIGVVAERNVHRAAVVPQDDVVLLPLMAIDELRPRRVLHQVVDQGPALLLGHAGEARDLLADIERLAAGLRMHAHDRLGDRRIELLLLLLALAM